jgi:hypothetical protein
MHKVNGMVIVPVRRGGVRGHVMRTKSGVKVGTFYGRDSFERALSCALGRDFSAGPGPAREHLERPHRV